MPTDTVSIAQFVEANGIKMSSVWASRNPNMPNSEREMDNWKCTLKMGRKSMTVHFSKGLGHHGAEPTADEVLDCLASDSRSADDCSFEQWCSEFGYDTDSRQAERTYQACHHSAVRLQNFLGTDLYGKLLYGTDAL